MSRLIRRIDAHEMGTGRVLPTMVTIGLPAAAGGIFQSAFEMTDTLFISWLGKDQISGVSLVGPLMFTAFAIAQAVNVGISALVSRHLGAGRKGEAQKVLTHGLVLSAVVGLLLTAVLMAALDPILRSLGASGEIAVQARQFCQIIFLGIALMHVGTAADGALRAQGDTVTPMQVGIVTNVANAFLNYALIYGLHMGVRGSATATLITRSIMCVVLVSRLWHPRCQVKPGGFRGLALAERLRVVGSLYWVGIPASVGMLAMSLSMVFINELLVKMDPYAVGVLGIAGRLEMMACVPVFGLFSAVVPMVGYNLGARAYGRIREVVWTSAWLSAAIMGAGGLVLFLFPTFFFGLFTKDPAMLPLGVSYLRIMMPWYPLIGASIMMSAGFQGLGKSWVAMVMHVWRNIATKLPFALWFGALWGLKGVWWSFPASTAASAGFVFVWMWYVLRGLGHEPVAEGEGCVGTVCVETAEAFHEEL
jgi:putative MATE family efflux protein